MPCVKFVFILMVHVLLKLASKSSDSLLFFGKGPKTATSVYRQSKSRRYMCVFSPSTEIFKSETYWQCTSLFFREIAQKSLTVFKKYYCGGHRSGHRHTDSRHIHSKAGLTTQQYDFENQTVSAAHFARRQWGGFSIVAHLSQRRIRG